MEVITIESNAFKELEAKINLIAKLLVEQKQYINMCCNSENSIDNYDVCSTLRMNESLLQRLRVNGLDAF